MCAICGIVNTEFNNLPKEKIKPILSTMANSMAYRGPDDKGYFIEQNVALAHRRLSVIDLEHGHQPMFDAEEQVYLILNGQIYNYLEIRQELIQKGYKFRTSSDSEVLVYAYKEYGEDCLKRFNGMFAFVLWDRKKHKLFGARDRLGIKPLYYTLEGKNFLFASEMKALLSYPTISAKANEEGIYDYLTFQFCLGNKTLFKNIYKLEPGYKFSITPSQGFKLRKYWDINYEIDDSHKEDYFINRLLILLEDSIKLRLRSDVPIGSYLSGGLDSSTIVSLAANFLPAKIKTFTGRFREKGFDESHYAKVVSNNAGADYSEILLTPADFMKIFPKLIYYMDEPAAGPGLFPQYYVAKAASRKVKVLLGGEGGDEIFGGYIRYLAAYLEQCLKGAIFQTNEEGEYVVTLNSIIPSLPSLKEYMPLLKYFTSNGLFEDMGKRYFRLVDKGEGTLSIFTRDFLQKRKKEFNPYEAFNSIFKKARTKSYFNKMSYFDIKTLLPALLQVEDRVAAANSLESRAPFLDHRIVELMASVPPVLKFKNGEAKYFLKQTVKNLIPREILGRKDKKGFPVPLTAWMQGPLKKFVLDILDSSSSRNRGIFDTKCLKEEIEKGRKFSRVLWGALCLEMWFQTFID